MVGNLWPASYIYTAFCFPDYNGHTLEHTLINTKMYPGWRVNKWEKNAACVLCQRPTQFANRFSDLRKYEPAFRLFANPMDFNVANAPEYLQMELIELQCSSEQRTRFKNMELINYYKQLSTITGSACNLEFIWISESHYL